MSKADLTPLPRRGIFAGTLAKPEKKARAQTLGNAKKAERKAGRKASLKAFAGRGSVDMLVAATGGKKAKPATVRGELIGVRMPPDMVKRLDKTVKAEGGTRQDIVRQLLEKGLVR